MLIERSWLVRGGAVLLGVVILWTAIEMMPGRRLAQCQESLLKAAGDRNWKKFRAFLDDDFRSAWGQNRDEAVQQASEVLGNFLVLEILSEGTSVERNGRDATISARLRLRGKGNAVGEAIISHANSMESQFQFAWTRKSWKPWDWKLVSVNQPEIDTMWTP
jgi:hypothetical protein